jgi:hypothetical protein
MIEKTVCCRAPIYTAVDYPERADDELWLICSMCYNIAATGGTVGEPEEDAEDLRSLHGRTGTEIPSRIMKSFLTWQGLTFGSILASIIAAVVIALFVRACSLPPTAELPEVRGQLVPAGPGESVLECSADVAAIPLTVSAGNKPFGDSPACYAFQVDVDRSSLELADSWQDEIEYCELAYYHDLLEFWLSLDGRSTGWLMITGNAFNPDSDKGYLLYQDPDSSSEVERIESYDPNSRVQNLYIRFDLFGYYSEASPYVGACGAGRDEGSRFSIWWRP